MTDLFVIDYGPMEDLMFWDRFARLLKERGADAPPALILLGSGERVQGLLGGPGAAPRTDGELHVDPGDAQKLERGMREELQSVVTRLTDEGLSTVGFSGLDRKLFHFTENPHGRPAVGRRAFESVTKWTDSGVIPILSCLARTQDDRVLDVHPARAAGCVADALIDTRIVLVAQRLTEPLRSLTADGDSLECSFSVVASALAEPSHARRLGENGLAVHLTHPDLGDLQSPPTLAFSE